MAKKADKEVMEMRNTLLKKKAALLSAKNPVYIAGDYFRPSILSQRNEFQVSTASSIQLLEAVKAMTLHELSTKVLDMSTDHLGFSLEEWFTDFKTRKAVLDRNENLRNVETLESKLRELLTPTQLREIGIGDLLSEIADL